MPFASPKVAAERSRLALNIGAEIKEQRLRRGWILKELASRAGVSITVAHDAEAGRAASFESYVRLAVALGLVPRFSISPERVARHIRDADPVHAAMGEIEAAQLRPRRHTVLVDEPYQHFQFAGRADLVAVAREERRLLHMENRTRFPDLQAFVGAYNAKRVYLAGILAERLEIRPGFVSVDHVVVALWSSEVLHTIRLRSATFRSVCPDPPDRFGAWWSGGDPSGSGTTSSLVLFDPLTGQRSSRRRWVGLDDVRAVEPRYSGYAKALDALRAAGLA